VKLPLDSRQAAEAESLFAAGERRHGIDCILLGQLNRDADGWHLCVIAIPHSTARKLRKTIEQERQRLAGTKSKAKQPHTAR
jgi:hypothetical protein